MLLHHVFAVILVLFLAAPRRLWLRLASASVLLVAKLKETDVKRLH